MDTDHDIAGSCSSEPTWSLTGRWVFPIDGPPLPNATVVVARDRITSVVRRGSVTADVDLGNVALLPGFVNAHTHLDLTGLRGQCPPTPDFTAWLRQVIAHRRAQTPEQIEGDIRAGLEQSLRHGVTLLGDIAAGGLSWPVLAAAPVRAVIFHELLGLTAERAEAAWQSALAWLQAHASTATCRAGLSPHAPYSVRTELFAQVAALPAEVPVAIHLAESLAELQLLDEQGGPFLDLLRAVGVWDESGLVASIAAMLDLYRQRQPLWIHGNYLDPDSATPSGTLVYCPRTHAAFHHAPHPFRQLRARGVPLALGTDSLASNPDLSILEEIRFLHQRHPDLDGDWLLHLATQAGADALGFGSQTGSLTPGKSADLVILPVPDRDDADPHRLVLESELEVRTVVFRGQFHPVRLTQSRA